VHVLSLNEQLKPKGVPLKCAKEMFFCTLDKIFHNSMLLPIYMDEDISNVSSRNWALMNSIGNYFEIAKLLKTWRMHGAML
jgi:hypothetical protein